MRSSFFFLPLFLFIVNFTQAQDAVLPINQGLEIESLPISLEAEEENMIFERHQARLRKGQQELKRELMQLESGQQEVEAELFYLQNQQQLSEGGQNAQSQELHTLYKKRTHLLAQVAAILMENELLENTEAEWVEDWERAPVGNSQKLTKLNEQIRMLDTKIALYELAIPQQIDELENLEEQIEEKMELADQLNMLKESNEKLIQQLNK